MNLPVFERSGTMSESEQDWEMSDDYYKNKDGDKKMRLEDFITEEDLNVSSFKSPDPSDELLKKTIDDVHKVLTLAQEGKSIAQIVTATGFDETYVYNIQVCAQGFREDDEIAVAHLVLG